MTSFEKDIRAGTKEKARPKAAPLKNALYIQVSKLEGVNRTHPELYISLVMCSLQRIVIQNPLDKIFPKTGMNSQVVCRGVERKGGCHNGCVLGAWKTAANSLKRSGCESQNETGGPFKPSFGLSGAIAAAYAFLVPWGLKRFQDTGQSHFVTFCCYHHRMLFTPLSTAQVFESALERVRRSFRLRVYGYVVMPEHVHLLLSEPKCGLLADALKSLKQGVSRRLIGSAQHFWQKRYYDFNVRNDEQFVEKLRYIHRNPVKAGLCERPEDWEWSSFRHYATGCEGRVEIESEWTARKRERLEGKLCSAIELPHSSQKKA